MTEIKGDFTDPAGRKFDTLHVEESAAEESAEPSVTEKIVNDTVERFSTPAWGRTLVINNIEKFTDAELITMKVFVLDEIARRKKGQQ